MTHQQRTNCLYQVRAARTMETLATYHLSDDILVGRRGRDLRLSFHPQYNSKSRHAWTKLRIYPRVWRNCWRATPSLQERKPSQLPPGLLPRTLAVVSQPSPDLPLHSILPCLLPLRQLSAIYEPFVSSAMRVLSWPWVLVCDLALLSAVVVQSCAGISISTTQELQIIALLLKMVSSIFQRDDFGCQCPVDVQLQSVGRGALLELPLVPASGAFYDGPPPPGGVVTPP